MKAGKHAEWKYEEKKASLNFHLDRKSKMYIVSIIQSLLQVCDKFEFKFEM